VITKDSHVYSMFPFVRNYDRPVPGKRAQAKRRKETDSRQRPAEDPLDEIFEDDERRLKRRRAWSTALEIAAAVLELIPWG
jgi:hypothetical protein